MLKLKKIIICIVSILLIFSFLSLFNYSADEKIVPSLKLDKNAVSEQSDCFGYELTSTDDGTVYKSLVGNACLTLSFEEKTFNTVIVTLDREIAEGAANAYSGLEGAPLFDDENALSVYAVSSGNSIVFRSDELLTTDNLTLNIDGEFAIENVSLYTADSSMATLKISIVSLSVILVLLVLLVIFEKKLGFFKLISQKIHDEKMRISELKLGKKLPFLLHVGALSFTAIFIAWTALLIAISRYSIVTIFITFFLAFISVALHLADRIRSGSEMKAAKLFLAVSLLVGIMFCYTSPATTHSSWDDEIHFRHAYEATDFLGASHSVAKHKMFSHNYTVVGYLGDPQEYVKVIATEDALPVEYEFDGCNLYTLISYAPMIAVNVLAKLCSVDLAKTVVLCRLANLIAYSFICYYGIKKLKNGAFLFSAVCLLPSVLYLACSIGYDFWLTAWLVYGFAYIISELQQPQKKITAKDILKILLAFFIGCSAKALYCLMMLPLLFLGNDKFPSRSHARKFRIFVVLTVIIIAAILIVPGLLFFDLYADSRGGTDVNSYGQIKYILTNPFEYAKTLLRHLGNYCSLRGFNEYNSTYGFIDGYDGSGSMFFGTLATAIIAICIFTDRNKDDMYDTKMMQRTRWITLFTCFAQIVFIVTSMYIGFNAVGSDVIHGTQFRYLFPLMCPMFYFLIPQSSVNIFTPRKYTAIIFTGLVFNLFSGYLLAYLIYI